MNLSIVIVHNKSKIINSSQIDYLNSILKINTEKHILYDDNEKEVGSYNTYYYTIDSIADSKVYVYQIIPYGIIPPENLYLIDSYKVFYGKGDEDKTGDSSRFFNWGIKKSLENGADLILFVKNIKKITMENFLSFSDEFLEKPEGIYIHKNFIKRYEYLDEKKDLSISFHEKRIKNG